MSKRYLWIVPFILLSGCIGKNVNKSPAKMPSWVNGSAVEYPNSMYITGSGSASSLEVAKNRALANLVKTFEVRVREDSKTQTDVQSTTRNGKEDYTKTIRLNQNINLETDKMVEGARIAETWQDKKVQEFYALAVLERSQASKNIRQSIADLDHTTQTEITRSQAASDPLLAMAALDQAYKSQLQRQGLQNMLKVIDLKGVGAPSKWNLADIRGDLENMLLQLRISSQVDQDPTGQLSQLLKGAMANAGFPAVNGAGDFTLVGTLTKTDLGKSDGWYWVRGNVTVKLVENATGKVRGTHSWSIKVSAQQQPVAHSRLITKAENNLKADLKQLILDFATGVES